MPDRIIFSAGNSGAGENEGSTMSNRLKVYRAMLDLTQEQLAGKIGVSRQTVIAIESDKYLPSLELAFKIARIFTVTIEDIFSYDDHEADAS